MKKEKRKTASGIYFCSGSIVETGVELICSYNQALCAPIYTSSSPRRMQRPIQQNNCDRI
jgi:hypothetical protein